MTAYPTIPPHHLTITFFTTTITTPPTHLQTPPTMSPTTAPSHRPSRLEFITGNANKLSEVRAILADTGVELSSKALDLPELQGGIEEISRDKCRRAAEAVSAA